jgi:hypothetical protein
MTYEIDEKKNKIEITPAIIQSHIDVITCLHYAIADTPENRKRLEDHVCKICCKKWCTGKGRCKATDLTMAQINLLTGLVIIRDEGSMELGIGEYDRVITIGVALEPFNPELAAYFKEEDKEALHIMLCLAKNKDTKLGKLDLPKLKIPDDYNIRTDRLYQR